MAESTLAAKMKMKPGVKAAFINAPPGYLDAFGPVPAGVQVFTALDGPMEWIQIFALTQAELDALLPLVVKALRPHTLLWISFPKASSNLQTDLTRDQGWDGVRGLYLKWINLVSVDETWSAFSMRPYKKGEERQSFR